MNRDTKIITGTAFILLVLFTISATAEGEQISGNSVFIDTPHAYISATPHTLTESGYVEFTILSKQFTGNIDAYWGFSKTSGVPKFAERWTGSEWVRIPNNYFKFKNTCYSGNHLWYYIENHAITANEEIKVRAWFNIKFNSEGKYDFICKPSHLNFSDAKNDSVLFHLDPWWNNEFLYRKEIILSGNTSGAQTDYQLLLNVTYESGMQADFDDLRFRSDTQQIDAWLKNKSNSNYSNVWVEFPSTPANGINQTYFMYYGNPDVSSDWNGSATFHFFDDFEDGDFSEKWNDISIGMGIVTESGGKIRICGGSSTGDNSGIFESKNAVISAGYRTDIDVQTTNIGTGNIISIDNPNGIVKNDGIVTNLNTGNKLLQKVISDSITTVDTHTLGTGTHTVGMHINTSGGCNFWLNDVEYTSSTGLDTSDMYIQHYSRRSANTYWLNVIVRKFVSDPPTYNFSEDEDTIFLQYNNSISITNIIAPDNEVWADNDNDTEWIMAGLINNVTVVMGTDYENSTGNFSVADGWINEIIVSNLTNGDIVVLYEEGNPIEIGLVSDNSYTFTTNIDIGSYSISIMGYPAGTTGIHGFVYEGTTGISDPLESVVVYIYNNTYSDTSVTDNGGYYAFTGLSNTTYVLNFKKDRYEEVISQYVTPENLSMVYKVIYMQKSTGDYYSRHYCTFTLKNIFGARYSNVDAVVYDNGVVEAMATTGTDGACTFHLFEDVEYTLSFTNATQGVDESVTLTPRDTAYTIYVDSLDLSLDDSATLRSNIQYHWDSERINGSHGWINFTLIDSTDSTTRVKYWINKTINGSYDEPYYFYDSEVPDTNMTWTPNSSFIVTHLCNASNTTFVVHFSATNPDFPELSGSVSHVISFFQNFRIDLEWQQIEYTITAVCALIFLALLFGAASAHIGAVVVCLGAWFFWWLNWLQPPEVLFVMLVFATVVSVTYAIRKGESLKA